MQRLREQIAAAHLVQSWDEQQLHANWQAAYPFDLPVFHGATGLELFEHLDAYASEKIGAPIIDVFSRHQPFWRFCQKLLQEWLLGDDLFPQVYGHTPAQVGKPGCLNFEEPLLPVEQVKTTLETLQNQGYTFGVATGRVLMEARAPLAKNGLWNYFNPNHLGTYDVVEKAEAALQAKGKLVHLGKPHPFQFWAAIDGQRAMTLASGEKPGESTVPFIAVGDSTSDMLAGRAAGGLTIAVLSGAHTPEARELLLSSQPDFVIQDMTALPELLDEIINLATIQRLQFERRELAEKLLRLWFAQQMDLVTESVRLTPRAVSLNSFNGFYQSSGQEYFFKTHVEAHGVLNEYYHAQALQDAGYHVVKPVQLLQEKDRQMVIYPVVDKPVMFDLMRAQETKQNLPLNITAETLIQAEADECARLLEIYSATLQTAQDTSQAPVHQLFWHRLAGKRFKQFYTGRELLLPAYVGSSWPIVSPGDRDTCLPRPRAITYERLCDLVWEVNGVEQDQTLGELVARGKQLLDPIESTASVVGHGDAHFGNVFLDHLDRFLYFDPAFAGRHSPLLDIVKPLFHNIFAMWMYFPQEISHDLALSVQLVGRNGL